MGKILAEHLDLDIGIYLFSTDGSLSDSASEVSLEETITGELERQKEPRMERSRKIDSSKMGSSGPAGPFGMGSQMGSAFRIQESSSEQTCELVHASSESLVIPDRISLHNPDKEGWEGSWWLVYFEADKVHFGYIAIRTNTEPQFVSTRKMIILHDTNATVELPETHVTVDTNLENKSYFHDIVLDIVEHFEVTMTQILSTERNKNLIRELEEKNNILNKSRQENKMAMQQSREWLSVMSHEIRTPLFAIYSLSDLLTEKFTSEDADILNSVVLIKNSAKHLSDLVNNILDFSKLEQNQVSFESVEMNIRELVEDAVSINVRNDLRNYPQTCIFIDDSVPAIVKGDPLRVKQIFVNIVNNAVKFTPDEGNIQVYVRCRIIPESRLVLEADIVDTGIGIKDADVHKIFKQYSQTDASITRKFGGSGLGLSICQKLCNLMEGNIVFRANSPEGTVFTFHVVLDTFEGEQPKKVQVHEKVSEINVKVLDDLEISKQCTTTALSRMGMKHVSQTEELSSILRGNEMYLVNVRSKSVMGDIDAFKNMLEKNDRNIIIHTNPYVKKSLGLQCKFEVLGPIVGSELLTVVEGSAQERGIVHLEKKHAERNLNPLNMHILVAEDNSVNQIVIKKMLTRFGVTADFANDGQEAVEMYLSKRENRYRIVLMDIMMPVMDGYTATRKIREISKDPMDPFIIALTANVFWEDKLKATECGMNDFLTKPVKLEVLYNLLKKSKLSLL
jgi:signal transduction histidine kinase/ActR/RegA family two-component response regulator